MARLITGILYVGVIDQPTGGVVAVNQRTDGGYRQLRGIERDPGDVRSIAAV